MTGIEQIAAERQRQIDKEDWSADHDDRYHANQLIRAAIAYLFTSIGWHPVRDGIVIWPWRKEFWKPRGRKRNLVRAGALLAAEIDRIERAERWAVQNDRDV